MIFLINTSFGKETKWNMNSLIERGGLFYSPTSTDPYSGEGFDLHENGAILVKGSFEDGKRIGQWSVYSASGVRSRTEKYIKGVLVELVEYDSTNIGGDEIPHGAVKKWYEDGQLNVSGFYAKGIREKTWYAWYPNGQIESKFSFENGKPDGKSEVWFENGKVKIEKQFGKNGLEGLSREWLENGLQKAAINFKDNKKHGYSTYWDENGDSLEYGKFISGQRVGIWNIWERWGLDSLRVKGEGDYDNSIRNGTWNWWFSSGEKISISYYEGGKLLPIGIDWYRNGRPKKKTVQIDQGRFLEQSWYESGIMEEETIFKPTGREMTHLVEFFGTHKTWFPSGSIASQVVYNDIGELKTETYFYQNGKKRSEKIASEDGYDATCSEWFESGQLALEGEYRYENSDEHGLVTKWYENGNIEQQAYYSFGTLEGLYKDYYESGTLKTKTLYKNGKKYGLYTSYYSSGEKKIAGVFSEEGELVGNYRFYKLDGSLKVVVYSTDLDEVDGLIVLTEDPKTPFSGLIVQLNKQMMVNAHGTIVNGKSEGKWVFFHGADQDKISQEGYYVDGKQDGKWTFYYESGKIMATAFYADDQIYGKYTKWDEEGQIVIERQY
jgi:uncharacterized protein